MDSQLAREASSTLPPQYGFGAGLRATTMEHARALVIEALAAEGFGVLTEIDLSATMKQKLGVDMPPYLILGACNPGIARRALEIEPYAGLFLPCNVTLRQDDAQREIVITVASPLAMMGITGDDRLRKLAREAETLLRGAVERIVA